MSRFLSREQRHGMDVSLAHRSNERHARRRGRPVRARSGRTGRVSDAFSICRASVTLTSKRITISGRLLTVFRLLSDAPLWKAYSTSGGKTWDKPSPCGAGAHCPPGMLSALPSRHGLSDDVMLCGPQACPAASGHSSYSCRAARWHWAQGALAWACGSRPPATEKTGPTRT